MIKSAKTLRKSKKDMGGRVMDDYVMIRNAQ